VHPFLVVVVFFDDRWDCVGFNLFRPARGVPALCGGWDIGFARTKVRARLRSVALTKSEGGRRKLSSEVHKSDVTFNTSYTKARQVCAHSDRVAYPAVCRATTGRRPDTCRGLRPWTTEMRPLPCVYQSLVSVESWRCSMGMQPV
jgi:hypothetical protein